MSARQQGGRAGADAALFLQVGRHPDDEGKVLDGPDTEAQRQQPGQRLAERLSTGPMKEPGAAGCAAGRLP
jgi:hypothetical protein